MKALIIVSSCLVSLCVSLTTVTLPYQVKGGGLSNLASVYNGTVTTESPASFYIKYNTSSYGFAAIVISSDYVFVDVQTSVTGNDMKSTGDSYYYGTSVVIDPTEADCQNPDESTDGGVNCLFLVIVTVDTDNYPYFSANDELSFETYGYVGQVFSTSEGVITSFSSIPKGYSRFYLGMFPYHSYTDDSSIYYYYDITIATNDSLAVYVYEGYHATSYVYSNPTFTSGDNVFSHLYGSNYISQVVASSSSSSAGASFDISVITNTETYDYDGGDSLSAGAISGIALGCIFGIALILLGIRLLMKVSSTWALCFANL
jgi:hypothetical protein